jgi:hypothetical protein
LWCIRRKTRRDRIRSKTASEVEIHNLLIDLEDKLLQWFGYIKGNDRTGISIWELDSKFSERDLWEETEQDASAM